MQRYLVKGLSALVFALGASIALAQGRPDLVEQSLRNPAREHVAGQMLVQFRRGVADVDKSAALARIDARHGRRRRDDAPAQRRQGRPAPGPPAVRTQRRRRDARPAERCHDRIRRAELDLPASGDRTTPTTRTGRSGACTAMRRARRMPTARRPARPGPGGSADCSGVWVGIIDEGYMYTHDDLAAQRRRNSGRVRGQRNRRRRQRLRR